MTKEEKYKLLHPQGKMICTVCGEEFEANDDTKYIIHGGYTCSWECFLTEAIKLDKEKSIREEQQVKRGRKRSVRSD